MYMPKHVLLHIKHKYKNKNLIIKTDIAGLKNFDDGLKYLNKIKLTILN